MPAINNEGYAVSLEMFAIYETVPDAEAAQRGLIRVIDESGEDYLYPKSRFESVDFSPENLALLSEGARRALLSADYADPPANRAHRRHA